MTPYEIWKGKKATIKYFRVFGLATNEGIFLGYSASSRVYRVFNFHTHTVIKSIDVVIDDDINDAIDFETLYSILEENEEELESEIQNSSIKDEMEETPSKNLLHVLRYINPKTIL